MSGDTAPRAGGSLTASTHRQDAYRFLVLCVKELAMKNKRLGRVKKVINRHGEANTQPSTLLILGHISMMRK